MNRKRIKVFREVLVVATTVFAFMTAACINKWTVLEQHPLAFLTTMLADIFILMAWIWILLQKCLWLKHHQNKIQKYYGMGITLVYCIASRIVQLKDIPRWDALQYYQMLRNACEKFDFTIDSFWENFIFASHPTIAFASITAIGEFLDPSGYKGVLLIWLLVTLIAAFCVYRILEKLLPRCSWHYHMLAACTVMTTPIVLGTFSYYQPDMGTVCFFLFLLYAYLYKRNLLTFFSMILLMMTKEIGIVVLAGFGLGILIGRVFFSEKDMTFKQRLAHFFREPIGIIGIIAASLLTIYFLFFFINGGRLWSYASSGFSFDANFIKFKFKQYFILNFNWLIWGANLILGIMGKIQRGRISGKIVKYKHEEIIWAISITAFSQIFFLSLYMTFSFPRYQELIDLCGVLLLMIQIGRVKKQKEIMSQNMFGEKLYWKEISIAGMGILLLIESYVTIDPLSLLSFEHENTGQGYIISESYNKDILQADYTVYNHQHNYLTGIYNHILSAVDYHEGMDVIIWNNPGSYELLEDNYYWDASARTITLKEDGNILVKGYVQDDIGKKDISFQEEAVFVVIPQFRIYEKEAEEYLNQYYEVRYKGSVTVGLSGEAVFYVCDLAAAGREI
ncbi:MAG TPA: hypothetical protein H9956_04475 [Candidatus Eisenbergiella pullicola]|nr:hypothetical protein [Candidatus Eisenbergiella pullicola]